MTEADIILSNKNKNKSYDEIVTRTYCSTKLKNT